MDPERQSVAGGVDCVAEIRQVFAPEADHMQDWAEDFVCEFLDGFDAKQGRGDECSVCAGSRQRRLKQNTAAFGLDIGVEGSLSARVDHRPDIRFKPCRITELQFGHRALQHLKNAVCDVVLKAEQAKGGATLPRGVESGSQHVDHHLFGKRGRVHDHGVLSARLRD